MKKDYEYIKLLKNYKDKKEGEIVKVNNQTANYMINELIAIHPDENELIDEDNYDILDDLKNNLLVKEFKRKKLKEKIRQSLDYKYILSELIDEFPIIYDKNKIWWLWEEETKKYEIVDETDILNIISDESELTNVAKGGIKSEILTTLQMIGRKNLPETPPVEWIHFKNYIFDIKTKKMFEPTPKYFFTNPIQWDIGDSEETPNIDKLFKEWVDEKYVKLLYEIIAYSLYRDYPIHRLFCFTGSGRNGKSRYLALLKKFIGGENTTSTELDILINNRFESSKLYKKLVCQLGETNDTILQNTALLKKLCGQDTIGYEFKNKNPFDDMNYAKIIIATNNLPTTLDKSDGFYRRWLIIDFPNQFPEGKDILETIPEEEYSNLARKCLNLIVDIIEKGSFTNEPDIEEKMLIYEEKSNPINGFVKQKCEENINYETPFHELYSEYINFLNDRGYREISKKKFSNLLSLNDYKIEKKHIIKKDGNETTWNFVVGIRLKPISTDTDNTDFTTLFTYRKLIEISVSLVSVGIGETDLIKFCREQIENFEVSKLLETIDKMKEKNEILEMPKGTYRRL